MSGANVISLSKRDRATELEAATAAKLVHEIRSGSAVAETELVERYSRGLRYLLARRIGDDERARDLLQDTFCIAIKKLRETDLENPERLAGYLRGIAVRVALNAGRQRRREPYPIDIEAIAAIEDREPRQFQQISRKQKLAAVRQLLDSMPVERDRNLLIRMYVHDQDKEEIRRALGLDSLHFNRVLFRAKKRFKKILEKSSIFDDFVSNKDS
ncbi:MAG: sigma-70 family RNA polymerase sigma factor [Gammaproteobacteria bacterium]|nr:sigma-70 family RNA polymerase sigma factor [Gammaproteobacteria bacterium]